MTYYEAQITVDPLHGRKLDHFKVICDQYGFEIVQNTLCIGQDTSLDDLTGMLGDLIEDLQAHDIHVWRSRLLDVMVDINKKKG